MERIDFRKLSDTVLKDMRRTAIRMIEAGKKQKDVALSLGCSARTVNLWWKAYRQEGKRSIEPKTRGRAYGQKRHLTPEQERSKKKILIDKHPEQLKLRYALSSRDAVRELISRETGILMPIRTVGEYLHRWGFTPQKPIRKAYEQQPQKVQ